MPRANNRPANKMRPISLERNFTCHAEGSVLVSFGNTKVLCTASIEHKVPRFLQDKKQGWITAEYSMLPRATHTRSRREASHGKQTGRTVEIQRLIGRSVRAAVDLSLLGEHTITIDCDVLQADGGTRTAAISGGFVALQDAIRHLLHSGRLKTNPIRHHIAAISVGIVQGQPLLDLDYNEDSQCETDLNIVMNQHFQLLEVQGTAEKNPFNINELNDMLALSKIAVQDIVAAQQAVLTADEMCTA